MNISPERSTLTFVILQMLAVGIPVFLAIFITARRGGRSPAIAAWRALGAVLIVMLGAYSVAKLLERNLLFGLTGIGVAALSALAWGTWDRLRPR